MIMLSMFAIEASTFISAGICGLAVYHHTLVWFVRVVTVVRLPEISTVPVGVTRISERTQVTDASTESLKTNSFMSSSVDLMIPIGV